MTSMPFWNLILDDFRQLIFSLQSPPGFCSRGDELEHHELGGRRRLLDFYIADCNVDVYIGGDFASLGGVLIPKPVLTVNVTQMLTLTNTKEDTLRSDQRRGQSVAAFGGDRPLDSRAVSHDRWVGNSDQG